jgi:membrane-bound metal-dependent hydrolase YbcI (DUF457 family)
VFIGHFGAGFAAKKLEPRLSLGTLFMAAQFIDLLWPIFLLLGLERVEIDPANTVVTPLHFVHYPYTHSLLAVLGWAALFGGVYLVVRKNLRRALILAGLVLSHWLLDVIVHAPDLPLWPSSDARIGLGLWNSLMGTLAVEGAIFAIGAFLYIRSTQAVSRTGSLALWGLIVFLVGVYLANLFGPPPPSAEPIGLLGLAQWLLVAWGYWIDRNRRVV